MPQSLVSLTTHIVFARRIANRSSTPTSPCAFTATSGASSPTPNRSCSPLEAWRITSTCSSRWPDDLDRGPDPQREDELVALGPRDLSHPVDVRLAIGVRRILREQIGDRTREGVHRESTSSPREGDVQGGVPEVPSRARPGVRRALRVGLTARVPPRWGSKMGVVRGPRAHALGYYRRPLRGEQTWGLPLRRGLAAVSGRQESEKIQDAFLTY